LNEWTRDALAYSNWYEKYFLEFSKCKSHEALKEKYTELLKSLPPRTMYESSQNPLTTRNYALDMAYEARKQQIDENELKPLSELRKKPFGKMKETLAQDKKKTDEEIVTNKLEQTVREFDSSRGKMAGRNDAEDDIIAENGVVVPVNDRQCPVCQSTIIAYHSKGGLFECTECNFTALADSGKFPLIKTARDRISKNKRVEEKTDIKKAIEIKDNPPLCPNCNKPYSDGDKFCKGCGIDIAHAIRNLDDARWYLKASKDAEEKGAKLFGKGKYTPTSYAPAPKPYLNYLRQAPSSVKAPEAFLNNKTEQYIIYHSKFRELWSVASWIKKYLVNKNPYWESVKVYSSDVKNFSKKNPLELMMFNKNVHLEIKIFSNGLDDEVILELVNKLQKHDYLYSQDSWKFNNNMLIFQFKYEKELADEKAEKILEEVKSIDKSDWMHPGGGLQQQFATPGEREEAIKTALGGQGSIKASWFQRIKTRLTDNLLKDKSYRKSVRDVCPRCKHPTLLARYNNGNNSNNPDYYECSNCGKKVMPSSEWFKSLLNKGKKLNWVDIAPKFMILVLGMFLFSWELITFGGGDFGGDFWIFAIIGTILGLISLILDFGEKKEEAEKEDEKRNGIKNTVIPGNNPKKTSYFSQSSTLPENEGTENDEEDEETETDGLTEEEKEAEKERKELRKQRGVSKAEVEEGEKKIKED